jgi:hypothetical protein
MNKVKVYIERICNLHFLALRHYPDIAAGHFCPQFSSIQLSIATSNQDFVIII